MPIEVCSGPAPSRTRAVALASGNLALKRPFGFTDYQSCQAYRTQHHGLMAERARQRGLNLPESGRDFCDRLKPTPPPPSGLE